MSCSPLASFGNQRACCSSRAGEGDRQRAELLDGQDQAGRGARPAELLDGEADAQQLPAEAAVLDRERQREDVVVGEQPPHVLGELGRSVDLGGARGDPLVGEDADRVAEHLVLFGQAVGPRGSARGRHGRHRSAGVAADRETSSRVLAPKEMQLARSGRSRDSRARFGL